MAEQTTALLSYGDSSSREDVVLNAIEITTARETSIFNMLGKTTAINTVHSYLTDTLRGVSANQFAVQETANYTASLATTPTRLTNIVEILAVPFVVSRTQQNIAHYHGQDELARQTEKALMDWGNNAEFDLLRSTQQSGQSSTTPQLAGIFVAISLASNTSAQTSGTALVASMLDGLMKVNWDVSNGDVATALFMGSYLRYVIDNFTQKSNVVVNAPGITNIIRTVSSYETSMGTIELYKHRYVFQTGDTTAGRLLALRPEKLKVAFLQKPYIDTNLARSGDYDWRAIVGKFTLEVHNQQSNWVSSGWFSG